MWLSATKSHNKRNQKSSKTTVIKTVKGQKDRNAEHSINSDGFVFWEGFFCIYIYFVNAELVSNLNFVVLKIKQNVEEGEIHIKSRALLRNYFMMKFDQRNVTYW